MQPELQSPTRAEAEACIGSREKILMLLAAVLLGIGFDYLFFDKSLGVSYPIFALLLLGYFFFSARDHINFRSIAGWFMLLVIVMLSLTFALHDNIILRILNFLGIPVLIVIYTLLVTNTSLFKANPLMIIVRFLERVTYLAVANSFKFFSFLGQALEIREEGKGSLKRQILIGLLISLPVLLLVIPLLSSADAVFSHYLQNITTYFPENLFIRVVFIAVLSLYVFGYAWSFKQTPREETPSPGKPGTVDPVIPITLLSLVNLVYLFFTIIQFSYLYGGASKVLPPGLTYAEYARRGFFELVAVTVINFLILLIIHRVIDQKRKSAPAAKVLLSFLVAFTCNMLFAAHFKMSLYEQAYGYTELRIYVHLFMLFMAAVFVFALLRIWLRKLPLLKAICVTALVFYLALNYMNVHGLVANMNYQRYVETGKIDTYYLMDLGSEAVPVLVELYRRCDPNVADRIYNNLIYRQEELAKRSRWMEYNLSSAEAEKLIEDTLK